MTELRRHLIAKLKVAELGCSMTERAMQERRHELLRQIHDELPHLRRLRSATVSWELSTESDGLKVCVFIDETPQLPLPVTGLRDPSNDIYRQDLQQVLHEQRSLPERYLFALRTDKHPESDEQIQRLRKHMTRQRKGPVHVASSIDGEQLELRPDSKVLPMSRQAVSSAVIDGLALSACKVTLLSPLVCDHDGKTLRSAGSRLTLSLHPSFQEQDEFLSLASALRERLKLQVTVSETFRWADGGTARFWLEAIGDDKTAPGSPIDSSTTTMDPS